VTDAVRAEPRERVNGTHGEHDRKTTFEEEYMEFLRRHDIKFEHRYLFEGEHHG
jgi:hypothetical protein